MTALLETPQPAPPAAAPAAAGPPEGGAREPRNFAFIDALRGVAALLVVYFHLHVHIFLRYPDRPIPPGSLSEWLVLGHFDLGKYAVAVFFLISGFLIPSTLAAPGATLRRYAIHRLFRLYPAYWFAILVWVVSGLVQGQTGALTSGLPQTLVNLTMLQRFVGVGDVIGAFWTLQIELVFYVVCGGLFVARRLERRRAAVLWSLALGLLVAAARFATHKNLPVALFLALALMFLGDTLRAHARGDVSDAERRQSLLAVAVGIVPICLLGYSGETVKYLSSYGAALATFLLALRYRGAFQGAGPVHRLFGFLGAISYGVYLLHDPLGLKPAEKVFTATGSHLLAALVAFAGPVFAAWVAHRLVELPMIALGKKLSSRPPLRPAAGPATASRGAGSGG